MTHNLFKFEDMRADDLSNNISDDKALAGVGNKNTENKPCDGSQLNI